MSSAVFHVPPSPGFRALQAVRSLALLLGVLGVSAMPARASWKLTTRAAFDDNVFLQEIGDLANRSSTVLTAAVDWRHQSQTAAGASWITSYTADGTAFLDESSESFHQHRLAWTLAQPVPRGTLKMTGNGLLSEGPNDPVIWPTKDGVPAGGAPSVRDRRDAVVWRLQATAPLTFGRWVVRPNACLYQHDFQSRHLDVPGCANAVDRSDVNAGVDVGRELGRTELVFLGVRWGRQDQGQLFSYPEQYDNTYTRLLALWERSAGPLRGSLAVGPEWRHFGERVAASFGSRHRTNLFAEAALQWTASPRHEWSASLKQFEQPGASGRSTCRDLAMELSWSQVVSPKVTTRMGGRAQRFDFRAPTKRDDWIYSLNASIRRVLSPQLTLTAEVQWQRGDSRLPNPGREYDRRFFALGLEYHGGSAGLR